MIFDLRDLSSCPQCKKGFFRQILEAVLESRRALENFEISLVLLNNAEMHKINQKYRGVNSATDVLSFNMGSSIAEIFISVEQARRQARQIGHSLERELAVLFIHGLLHILGYDDATAKQRVKMLALQDKIFQNLEKKII